MCKAFIYIWTVKKKILLKISLSEIFIEVFFPYSCVTLHAFFLRYRFFWSSGRRDATILSLTHRSKDQASDPSPKLYTFVYTPQTNRLGTHFFHYITEGRGGREVLTIKKKKGLKKESARQENKGMRFRADGADKSAGKLSPLVIRHDVLHIIRRLILWFLCFSRYILRIPQRLLSVTV